MIKKYFWKSSYRIKVLKQSMQNIRLEPNPIVAHCPCLWSAVNYYYEYFDQFKIVIKEHNVEDTISIQICKTLIRKKEITNELSFINANYWYIPKEIEKPEAKDLLLYDTISSYENTNDWEIRKKINQSFRNHFLKFQI